MNIRFICTVHSNAAVIPADDDMNVVFNLTSAGIISKPSDKCIKVDESNLYCCATEAQLFVTEDHEFGIVIVTS
jgi:hypothetical protein